MKTAYLIDDGTLDTVIKVGTREYRYNYDPDSGETYEDFIKWALEDAQEFHETESTDSMKD